MLPPRDADVSLGFRVEDLGSLSPKPYLQTPNPNKKRGAWENQALRRRTRFLDFGRFAGSR